MQSGQMSNEEFATMLNDCGSSDINESVWNEVSSALQNAEDKPHPHIINMQSQMHPQSTLCNEEIFISVPSKDHQKLKHEASAWKQIQKKLSKDKQIYICLDQTCLEQRCFNENEKQAKLKQHEGHEILSKAQILTKIECLRTNKETLEISSEKMNETLRQLNKIYGQVQTFEREILGLFFNLKQRVHKHIDLVKSSFTLDPYIKAKELIQKQFNYQNVLYALNLLADLKKVYHPNLDYTNFKITLMKQRIAQANAMYKTQTIESLINWMKRLTAYELSDKRKKSKSIQSFLEKTISDKLMFSFFLKNPEYTVSPNGKLLTKQIETNENVAAVAVIEKMLTDEIEVRLKIKRLINYVSIGFADITPMERENFQNSIKFGYFVNSKCKLIPSQKWQKIYCKPFGFQEGQIVSLRRQANSIVFKKNGIEQFILHLTYQESKVDLYCVVEMKGINSAIEIID